VLRTALVSVSYILAGGLNFSPAADPVLFKTNSGNVEALAFSPDGKTLAAAGADRTVHLWDTTARKVRLTLKPHERHVGSLAFSPDSKLLATGGYGPSPPGKLFDVTGEAKVFDAATGKVLQTFDADGGIEAVVFCRDGKCIAAGGHDKPVWVWEVESGLESLTLGGHKDKVRGLAADKGGERLFSAAQDGTVRVWNLETGKTEAVLDGGKGMATSVAVTPDGKRAVVTGPGGVARVWDLKTGKEERQFEGHTGPVLSVAVSPDGGTVVSASSLKGGEVIVWEVATGKELRVIKFPKESGPFRVAFSPDGKSFAVGCWGGAVHLYDAKKE
jgi:WD40 repeat protein